MADEDTALRGEIQEMSKEVKRRNLTNDIRGVNVKVAGIFPP
jgi:hypothetical protein